MEDGTVNMLEDFDEDEKFAEFLDHYSTGTYYFTDVNLVLNGDILNLILMDVDGLYTHLLTESHVMKMVENIVQGHPIFFQSLRKFLSRPNKKVSYVIGNHDIGMIFEGAQKIFNDAVGAQVEFTHQLVTHGVLIEHGHRFEPQNTVPRSKLLIMGPDNMPILNLPWASLFCIYLLPKLKEHRPYFDKVRPISLYIWWALIHDFRFFVYLSWVVVAYILRTQFPPFGRYNKNFRISLKQLANIAIHPKYETNAKRIFATRPDIQVVIMGHTHITEWRRFKDGKQYFNCGTWNHVPSMDKALHKNITGLSYVCVEINEKKGDIKTATLNEWHGKWRPYREVIIA
jgi:UDP-2,3-diacylglucosamine pyrophosphatase LpxH